MRWDCIMHRGGVNPLRSHQWFNRKIADPHDLNILSHFNIVYPRLNRTSDRNPRLNRTPNRNPRSDSDTIPLERDQDQTLHESDTSYIVSDSGVSSLTPGECCVCVRRSLETDPTCTSSHPVHHGCHYSSCSPILWHWKLWHLWFLHQVHIEHWTSLTILTGQ